MRCYTKQHRYNCGIDLHARTMYVVVTDQAGQVLVERNMKTDAQAFLHLVAPYREELVVAVECIFTWYWLADLCAKEGIVFVLGHALYMKAIHGGKAKNDKIDAHKIVHARRNPWGWRAGKASAEVQLTAVAGRVTAPGFPMAAQAAFGR